MRTLHIKGIEIIDDPKVPDGEVWILCPMQNGGKVRYMFNLVDHRMTQPGADESFFQSLQGWLRDLRGEVSSSPDVAEARIDLILTAMDDFLRGEDTRTIPKNVRPSESENLGGSG